MSPASKPVPWLVGVALTPFLVVGVVLVAVCVGVMVAGAALLGQLRWEKELP